VHKDNLIRTVAMEDVQAMGNLFQRRHLEAKEFNATLLRIGGGGKMPSSQFQLAVPSEKGLAGKRAIRRQAILDNAQYLSNSPSEIEAGLTKVPVKLDLEIDGYKLRDSFLWSLPDAGLSPEEFAQMTCEDFELPPSLFVQPIAKAIQEQLQEYQEFLGMLRMMGGLKAFVGIRGLVRLDVTIEHISLLDRFEWDLGDRRSSPEAFCETYTKELALGPQFVAAIAVDIYEQVYLLRRALLQSGFQRDPNTGHLNRLQDPDLAELIAVSTESSPFMRDPTRLDEFTPLVTYLDALELDRLEVSRDRDARRKRRQAKTKRVESLSVRSPPKTLLTPLDYRGTLNRQLKLADDPTVDVPSASSRGRRKRQR
jgi:hypothetical protein